MYDCETSVGSIMYVYSRGHFGERIMSALTFVSNPLQYF